MCKRPIQHYLVFLDVDITEIVAVICVSASYIFVKDNLFLASGGSKGPLFHPRQKTNVEEEKSSSCLSVGLCFGEASVYIPPVARLAMAHAGVVLDKDQFNCSVCLEILKDPVTIPCGHSYCSNCIKNYWDQDDFLGVFACPQCRKHFSPRPLLARNTMLADVVEKFRTTGLQESTTPPDNSPAEADDVQCDVCAGLKNKAVKSCLVCLASYCELHIQPHYDSAAFKTHKLVSATKRLQDTICGQHNKLLEVFCRTDRQCICYLCLTDEHKGHDTVLAEVEIQDKQVNQSSNGLTTFTFPHCLRPGPLSVLDEGTTVVTEGFCRVWNLVF